MFDNNLKKKTREDFINNIFTSVSEKYDLMNDLMSFGLHRLWKQKIIAMLKVNKNSIVLDLASGSGDITRKIKEQYDCMCISIDANMEMIDIAKKKHKKIHLILLKVRLNICHLEAYLLIM